MTNLYDIGLVGLGVMGRNLLLNFADNGVRVVGYDTDPEKVARLKAEGDPERVGGETQVEPFIASLSKPRTLVLLVPAGAPVDAAIAGLIPQLSPGDRIVEGGNSHFRDTERREKDLAGRGIQYVGLGISGGEEGARRGPSLMFGGDKKTYDSLRPWLEAVSATAAGEPCVAYLGPRGAGHYVKMVHNAIEYGWMQLLAETVDLLHRGAGLGWKEISNLLTEWNKKTFGAFLVEITAEVLRKIDPLTSRPLVEFVADVARAKGTGKWASEQARELQVPVPSIDAAVTWRDLSKWKDDRTVLSKMWGSSVRSYSGDKTELVERVGAALETSFWITLSQGMALLTEASRAYEYDLNLESVTKVWRSGCILRASLLETAASAYHSNPKIGHLMESRQVGEIVSTKAESLRAVAAVSLHCGIAAPAMTSSIQYWDAFRDARLPMFVIQAQRDYFGAHGYERTDRTGTFHSDWKSER